MIVFTILACGAAWLVALLLWLAGDGRANPIAALVSAGGDVHTAAGHPGCRSPRANLLGVGLMVGGCTFYGVLLGWLRPRTGSRWPAVFAHGAFNATAGFLGLVVAAGSVADPVALGPLVWVAWIIMGLVIGVLVLTGQFRRQPQLGRMPVPRVTTDQ
ncbi:CAAX prenyl protease-like protein [Cryobacterium psychrophilum]|nr:CAAX prenyl protease-like protein [Cryobacterium psychrophilum]